jgi:hypothetical protein
MSTKIQIRRGLAATWVSSNPILSSGELGLETDTNKVKIGNGSTAWNSLEYFYDQSALSIASASATYLTQAAYASASPNFATDAELASAIVTASAAAVAYADALTTADVAENTNLYFTNERAVNAGSATYILQTSQQGIINSASAAAVTAVLDGAPGALDTLNELAAALNDDSSFATTVTNSLAAKLDASSASTTYLTQTSASSTYLTQLSASTIYATKEEAGSSLLNIIEPEGIIDSVNSAATWTTTTIGGANQMNTIRSISYNNNLWILGGYTGIKNFNRWNNLDHKNK